MSHIEITSHKSVTVKANYMRNPSLDECKQDAIQVAKLLDCPVYLEYRSHKYVVDKLGNCTKLK